MKPRLLDLFCGAGGCTKGYQRSGFYVVGVDNRPQPHYCGDVFLLEDAFEVPLEGFHAIHASPPCQFGSRTQRISGREYPNLIEPVRYMLEATGLPYVIENVPEAFRWLRDPIRLEGQVFGLNTHRPRLFETNWPLQAPVLMPPPPPQAKMGRPVRPGEAIQVVGHFSDVDAARKAMGIDWMGRNELSQAIPPAYTEFIGEFLMQVVESRRQVQV